MILKHQHFDLLEKIVLERVVFKPPFVANASMHNEACFLYARNGQSHVYSADSKIDLNVNEGVVMKCGNYLNKWYNCPDSDTCDALAVHFYPEVLKLIYDNEIPEFLSSKRSPKPVTIEKVEIGAMIEKYVESILFYFENPSMVSNDLIKLKVKELILLLMNSRDGQRIISILQDLFNPDEYDFKKVIEKHLFEDLSVEDLAILTNMSVSSFKRKFKEVFGDSPAHYIKVNRLEKAAELLNVTNRRVMEICFEAGFSDSGHFSKVFAAHFGCTPTEYRSKFSNL